jgi:uncharacterized metal-binding protein
MVRTTEPRQEKALIYSCSGCSSAAQLANTVAVRIDREGHAEMSCIAGVGGDVPSLVKVAKSGRKIVVIDGCPLQCAKSCLKRHDVSPDQHHVLSHYGVKKIQHGSFETAQAEEVYESVLGGLKKLAEGP